MACWTCRRRCSPLRQGLLARDVEDTGMGASSPRRLLPSLRRGATVLVVLASVTTACLVAHAARYRSPFDRGWDGCTATWDYQKKPLTCHRKPALLVGEEVTSLQVGTERNGQPVRASFRLLTYRCEHDQHQIRVWVTREDPPRVCEVSCHGRVAGNKGYDEDHGGLAASCKDDHTLYLKGGVQGRVQPFSGRGARALRSRAAQTWRRR